MVLGIPRAFLYYRYRSLWESFFDALGVEYVLSGKTDKGILDRGTQLAIDEACLSSKIYLGHVDALIGRCDKVFVPRISNYGKGNILCTKFSALYDIVANTFYDRPIDILDYDLDIRDSKGEMAAFFDLGKTLGKKRAHSIAAYTVAKQAERLDNAEKAREQQALLERVGMKILVVGHSYNIYDEYVGAPVLGYLKSMGVTAVLADAMDRKQALAAAPSMTETMPWLFNREQVGAVELCSNSVDGIILLTSFPCGPDSLANEIIMRHTNLPVLNLLIDSQDATAGMETRLESFIDIIQFRQQASAERIS